MIPRLGDGNGKMIDFSDVWSDAFFMIPRLGDGNLSFREFLLVESQLFL